MTIEQRPVDPVGRRRFFVRAITALHAAMGATMTFILGGAVLAPSFERRGDSWLRATSTDVLRDGEPLAVTLRVARRDGYTQVVDRTVVYLVKISEREVRGMRSTCTHLGCRTTYDRQARVIRCPCHGGVYDLEGNVVSGPPPSPLPTVATRVENNQVFVQV